MNSNNMIDNFRTLLFLFVLFIIITFSPVFVAAFTVGDVVITDILNADLSMTEEILISVTNNNQSEFTLELPTGAQDIMINGVSLNDTTTRISTPIQCDNCTTNITYSFLNIALTYTDTNTNETGYIFRRVISMPVNVSSLNYVLKLPTGYELFDANNLASSLLPSPNNLTEQNIFKWYYDTPEFPKEFAVRYVDSQPREKLRLHQESTNIQYYLLLTLLIILLAILIFMIVQRIKKARKKKR